MSVITQERQDQAAPAAVRRPASGVAIDPGRLAWYRQSDDMGHPTWSRQDLSDAIARLGLADENGEPLTVTRDAIAKIENGERSPKPRTVRALCAALGISVRDLMPDPDHPLVPHDDAEERKLRLAHNKDLRAFARAHGIQYRNPVSGRVYYSVPLEVAFAASVAGASEQDMAGLIEQARGAAPETGVTGGNSVTGGDGIGELDLSVRTHNTLIRGFGHGSGIRTIAELTRYSADELLDLRGFGAASVTEVRGKLAAAGFALAGEGADSRDPELLAS
jgi:transcriptional regulator with XRE-family HTH domain